MHSILLSRLSRFVVIWALVAGSAGCDDTSLTVAERLQRADEYRSSGDLTAAIIEIKNALQKNPESAAARFLLGEIYVDIGDGASAEKELVVARDLGIDRESVLKPLGRAWLLQQKFIEVLEQILFDDQVSPQLQATILTLRGEAYFWSQQTSQAKSAFDAALAVKPDEFEAIVGLVRVAMTERDWALAESEVARASALAENDLAVLAVAGDVALIQDKFLEAEAAFEKALEQRPENLALHTALARAKIGLEKLAEARDLLDVVLEAVPDSIEASYLRALTAYLANDLKDAKAFCEQTLRLSLGHIPVHLICGATSFGLAEFEQANQYMTRYLAVDPSHVAGRKLLGATQLRLGRSMEALNTLQPIAEETDQDTELLALVGAAALRSGELTVASKYFQQAVDLNPENSTLRARLGLARLQMGDSDAGLLELERAIEENSDLEGAEVRLIMHFIQSGELDEADRAVERLKSRHADLAAPYDLEAAIHAARNDFDAAKAALRKGLAIEPTHATATLNLGALEAREGNLAEARTLYGQILENNPGHLKALMRLARLEIRLEDRPAAREWLKQAVETNPDSIDAHVALMRSHFDDNDPRKALTVAQKIASAGRDDSAYLEVLGRLQMVVQRWSEALSTFQRLVDREPQSVNAALWLAQAALARSDVGQARSAFQAVLTLEPDHLYAKVASARLAVADDDLAVAAAFLAELKDVVPDSREVWEIEAGVAALEDRPDDAILAYQRVIESWPQTEMVLTLSRIQWGSDRPEDALASLNDWLVRYPSDQIARFLLGEFHMGLGQWDDARAVYAAIVEVQPDSVTSLNNLAWSLHKLGDNAAAMRHAEHASGMAPEDPVVMDTLAALLLADGQIEQALALLRNASLQLPDNPTVNFHFAQALAKSGDAAAAADVLQRILADERPFTDRDAAAALLEELSAQ
ncbi:MAG: PEP-CTERM system TPR-repeat protein PrsT [Alphaproteobacteria bacterium]|nr:PEP-CTERM system TPR-repeat protein PrsT [Alphaproteobacteria bacterium]